MTWLNATLIYGLLVLTAALLLGRNHRPWYWVAWLIITIFYIRAAGPIFGA